QHLSAALAEGRLPAIPVTTHPAGEVAAAFRALSRARHVGKRAVVTDAPPAVPVRADGTYLLTGGVGALGLLTAERLGQRGARSLILAARRAPGPQARERIAALEARGVRVHVRRADVARREDVEGLVAAAPPEAPLRGVFHAAGVVEDALALET